MFNSWREAAESMGFASPRTQNPAGFASPRTQEGGGFQSPQRFAGGMSPADLDAQRFEAQYVTQWSDRVQGWGEQALAEQLARGVPPGWKPENPFDIPTAAEVAAGSTTGQSSARTGGRRRTGGGGTPATAGPSGSGWEVQNQWDGAYTSAAKSTGVPGNVIKAVQALETGKFWQGEQAYGSNCNVRARDDGTPNCVAINTGIYQTTAEAYGLDYERIVSDPQYAIYAMGVVLSEIANDDAGQWGGAPGQTVVDQAGWEGVAKVYHGGAVLGSDFVDENGASSSGYVENFSVYLEELGGVGNPVPEQAVSPGAAAAAQPLPGAPTGKITHVAEMWGGSDQVITQEMGSMDGSIYNNNPTIYDYCRELGVDGHCGLDVGLARGAELASPVAGQVVGVGGQYFTDGAGGVGEIRVQAENGDIIILGHMASSSVQVGDYIDVGTMLGASGQSDSRAESAHLHLEVRVLQPDGTYRATDPRTYFAAAAQSGVR